MEILNISTIDATEQSDIETDDLYAEVTKKFDVFHIAVNDPHNCYSYHKDGIENTFGQLLGSRLKVSTINELSGKIEECIDESINSFGSTVSGKTNVVNENGEIQW